VAEVRLRPGQPIQAAINQFKKAVEQDGILKALRAKEFYVKPSVSRKLKSINARKNAKKRQKPDRGDR
jgi:small subunit ribosomal protein S21